MSSAWLLPHLQGKGRLYATKLATVLLAGCMHGGKQRVPVVPKAFDRLKCTVGR